MTLKDSQANCGGLLRDVFARAQRLGGMSRPALIGALVLVIGFTLTFAAWRSMVRADARAQAERFAFITSKFHDTISAHRQLHAQELIAGVALAQTIGVVTAEHWRSIYVNMRVAERHSGVQGLGFVELVQARNRAAFEDRIRTEGYHDYVIHPAGERETYAAIAYMEPDAARVPRVHGFDMFTDPVRREAMERARDHGKVATSGRVVLFHDKALQPGFLLYLPVYGPMLPNPDVTERRRALRGFVFSPVRTLSFFDAIKDSFEADVGRHLAIEVFDGAAAKPESLIYQEHEAEILPGAMTHVGAYDLFDRPWSVRLTALPAFEASLDRRARMTILLGGSAITLLMGALAASTAARNREQQEIARNKDMIARELSHRVKNLLSVIQSVASRSLSDGRSLPDARRVLSDRIAALARVHSSLVDAQWSGAMLHDLVNGELAPFGARVIVIGPALRVNAQMSQHLAMAVHELATNAVKYGALSQPTGSVRVEWRVLQGEDGQRFRFCWRESGGPLVSDPQHEGFGQKLLRRLLGSALSAQPRIDYAPEGLRYRFECDLSRIGDVPDVGVVKKRA